MLAQCLARRSKLEPDLVVDAMLLLVFGKAYLRFWIWITSLHGASTH